MFFIYEAGGSTLSESRFLGLFQQPVGTTLFDDPLIVSYFFVSLDFLIDSGPLDLLSEVGHDLLPDAIATDAYPLANSTENRFLGLVFSSLVALNYSTIRFRVLIFSCHKYFFFVIEAGPLD